MGLLLLGQGEGGGRERKRGKTFSYLPILALPDAHTSLQSEETINTL